MPIVPQIRINKSQEVETVLGYLKSRYTLLDESEIVKLALSNFFNNEIKDIHLDSPLHPYYSTLTPEEEKGVAISQVELKKQKNLTTLSTPEDISQFIKNLKS
jgi:hypothetical protein